MRARAIKWSKRAVKLAVAIPVGSAIGLTGFALYSNYQGYPKMNQLSRTEHYKLTDPLVSEEIRTELEKKQILRWNSFKYWRMTEREDPSKTVSNRNPLILEDEHSGSKIIILGTNHEMGKQSRDMVLELIKSYQPSIVAVEQSADVFKASLIRAAMAYPDTFNFRNLSIFKMTSSQEEKEKMEFDEKLMQGLVVKAGERGIDVSNRAGEEFITALVAAHERNLELVLVDRNQFTTLRRIVRGMIVDFFDTFNSKSPSILDFEEFQRVVPMMYDDKHVNREFVRGLSDVLEQSYPNFRSALLVERDLVMTRNLKKLSQEGKTIVAVVGCAHLDGIEKYWEYSSSCVGCSL